MSVWGLMNKKIKRYFGGIAILYKSELRKSLKFLEHKNEDYVWLQLQKEYFGFEKDLFICFAYIPPENSPYYKVRNQNHFELY